MKKPSVTLFWYIVVRVFRQSVGYLIDLKKLKTEASEAWFNNKRKALQKALQNLQFLN